MRQFIRHITNFYIYSSLHIGICGLYLYLFTVERFNLEVDVRYMLFILSSTIFIYSIHRLIGIKKVRKFAHKGRFAIIEKFKNHITLYALISMVVTLLLVFGFDKNRIILMSGAGIVSILYTIPIFGKSMRLRDFSFIKIFLIAIVWSYVTGAIPMYENGLHMDYTFWYFLEIILFFIAITIPFDIRDFSVDMTNGVQTIPTLIGRTRAIKLSQVLITITILLECFLTPAYNVPTIGAACMIATCFLTGFIIYKIQNSESDYYYSGLLDATIMFPYSIYVAISLF